MIKNIVTKLNKTKVELSNGISFTIVHNFRTMNGNVNSFDAAFQSWLARTDDYTSDSFVEYVKSKNEYGRIFVTLEDYESITKGKVELATQEDYQSENN